jgi:hypothetical protein
MPQFVSPIGLGTPGTAGYGSGSARPIRAAVSAASSLPLGANLVTNGTFDTNLSGWTNNGNWSWNSGHALHATGSTATLQGNVTLNSTQHYMITVVIGGTSVSSVGLMVDGVNVGLALVNGTYQFPWWPSQNSNNIVFTPTLATFNGYIDSITFQLVSGTATPQLLLDVPENTAAVEFRADPSMQDVAIGYQAAQTGLLPRGVPIGYQALATAMVNADQTAVGWLALTSSPNGDKNTAIGSQAMSGSTGGSSNTAVGYRAGRNPSDVLSGNEGTYIGANTGPKNSSSGQNVAVGANASAYNSAVAVGYNASVGDNYGVAIGNNASVAASGQGAIVIGNAATATATGLLGVAIGWGAQVAAQGNVCIGYSAGNTLTGGATTIIGYQAGQVLTTATSNTMVGYQAGKSATGSANTLLGANAGNALTTGANNALIGNLAGSTLTSASGATCVGYGAGNNLGAGTIGATVVGYNALSGQATGDRCTAVGWQAGLGTGNTDATFVGYNTTGSGGGTVIGASATASGGWGTAIGWKAGANGAGSVAIGIDSSGTAVTTAVTNEFKLGTANHRYNFPGQLNAALNAGAQLITNLATPVSPADAATKAYVDSGGSGVAASLFDANTILKADVDNTPLALTVGASTLVGRGAAGSIAALTAAQAKTVLAITPTDVSGFDTQVRTSRIDQMAVPQSNLNMNAQAISGASIFMMTGSSTDGSINLPLNGTIRANTGAGSVQILRTTSTGVSLGGNVGFFNATPAALDTGWTVGSYTPFRAGISSGLTVTDCANALATLITVLKGYGLLA